MEVSNNQFPVVVQAYDTANKQDIFLAEQVVQSQTEIDHFTARFTGKLIKARSLTDTEVRNNPATAQRSRSGISAGMIVLLLVVILLVVGFATGWIQRTFNLSFT